jgi:hypothetical protein
MSRDQLGEMLRRQELLSNLGAKDTDNARTQLKLGLEKYKTQQALSAALGEEVYNNLVNASTQEKISAFMDKIKTSLVDFIEKSHLIDKIQNFVEFISKPQNIKRILASLKEFIADAIETIGSIAYYIVNALDYVSFGKIPDSFIENIKIKSESMAASVRSVGEPVTVGGAVASSMAVGSPAGSTSPAAQATTNAAPQAVTLVNYNVYDGEKSAPSVRKYFMGSSSDNVSGFFGMERNISSPGQY